MLLVNHHLLLTNFSIIGVIRKGRVVLIGVQVLRERIALLQFGRQYLIVDVSDLVILQNLVKKMDIVGEILSKLENQSTDAVHCRLLQRTLGSRNNSRQRMNHKRGKVRNIDSAREFRKAFNSRLSDAGRVLCPVKQAHNGWNNQVHILLSARTKY